MSCVYVTNNTAPHRHQIGLGSDDAIQVFLNDVDVTYGGLAICRDYGSPNQEQSIIPVTIPPIRREPPPPEGLRRLLPSDSDSVSRTPEPEGPGLMLPDISVSLESAWNPRPGKVERSFSPEEARAGEPTR